ncbi:MAG: hypothetical protein CR976_02005 [Thiotrichales bacterium]|nr:MAG: hypothetical protein CR976_02005 [Thiotrichales bacterium]
MHETFLHPKTISNEESQRVFGDRLSREYRLADLLRRPHVTYDSLMSLDVLKGDVRLDEKVIEQVEIQCKYAGYIERQMGEIDKQKRHEETNLPAWLDYANVQGLSNEVRQKLTEQRPVTLGQAARIPGMTPAAISLLLVHLKKQSLHNNRSKAGA